ncbi:hypothetical protein MBLNU230_g3442t1 [Neophaeotheca triangularis]
MSQKARPTTTPGTEQQPWQTDSALNTPDVTLMYQQDGDESDSHSSMVSEAGSNHEDVTMSDDDEPMDASTFSASSDLQSQHPATPQNLWRTRVQSNRVATPIMPPRPGARPLQASPGAIKQHVRARHPQENLSSDAGRPEIPSPIDEDEVPTPPSASAAEAAGSQLSMLSVNDMDMEDAGVESPFPEPEQGLQIGRSRDRDEAVDTTRSDVVRVQKQRQRSGAMSGGENSPARGGPMGLDGGLTGGKRGFSMGYRSDCEKCRLRVPGHMNHFIA